MSKQGSANQNPSDGSESDSSEGSQGTGSAPEDIPDPPPFPAPPAFPAPHPLGLVVPPPPPGRRGDGIPTPRRELAPYETLDYQLDEKLGNRGVWNQDTRSYAYRLPTVVKKREYPADEEYRKQSAIAVTRDTYQSVVPEGAEKKPYQPYNYTPESAYTNVRDRQGNDNQEELASEEHTFYPPPRVNFPETTGIGSTNQPRYQEIPEELRYAAYGRPNEPYHPSNRVKLATTKPRPFQDKPMDLKGTPMSEIPTEPRIKGAHWDPKNKQLPKLGLTQRRSTLKYRKVEMAPVRTMPTLGENEELDLDGVPSGTRRASWSARSNRVAEIHPGTYDRTQGGRLRLKGKQRTDQRLAPRAEAEDTHLEGDDSSTSSRSSGSSGSEEGATAADPETPPEDSSTQSASTQTKKKKKSLLGSFMNIFKKKKKKE